MIESGGVTAGCFWCFPGGRDGRAGGEGCRADRVDDEDVECFAGLGLAHPAAGKLDVVQFDRGELPVTQVALFHSALGVRPGVADAAERLRAAGHHVLVADLYEGQVFEDYDGGRAFAESIGSYPELMRRAVAAVKGLPDGFVAIGFSNGGGIAEYIATQRRAAGAVMISGALPVEMLGAESWPAGVPAQIHYTTGDPFRRQEWIDAVAASARAAGAPIELFDYPGAGHLFTDASLAGEYQPAEAALMWQRVLAFAPLQA